MLNKMLNKITSNQVTWSMMGVLITSFIVLLTGLVPSFFISVFLAAYMIVCLFILDKVSKREAVEWGEKVAIYYEVIKDFTIEKAIQNPEKMQTINDITFEQLRRIIDSNKNKESVKIMQEVVQEVKDEEATK